ncbi:MAG: prolyl oligopeptidase family serine peptidase [Prosthecobacter sp.]|uniref:prolyl oligopeptidase family serine peptidase n=1 Tax=Prosthecobacter sp. TaxID=1965333 RepID=UPI0039010B4B
MPSVVAQTAFDAARSLPKRTESKVFRDRVKANWLSGGKTFWYRVQTGPPTHEFVLIDATTGARKTAPTLKALGLPEKAAVKTSTAKIELRPTQRTGEESGLKFINQLGEDVDLFWINQQGEHLRYGGIRVGMEREQHTFDGHVWLITSRTGEHLAVIEAGPVVQTLIIDGKGLTKAKEEPKKPERGAKSPDGTCIVTSEADAVPKRQITLVDSSPKDGLQPKTKVIDYLKPGDPLPKPQLVINQTSGEKIRVPRDLYANPFTESGKLDITWSPDSSEFYFDYNQRGHQLYRILAANAKTGAVRVVVEEQAKTFIDYTKKTWRHWLHSSGELIWMSERDGWCHLWLYDAKTGQVKNQITKGAWPVREVLHVDDAKREVWFLASALQAAEDPYHLHLCRVKLDGSEFRQLTEGDGNHHVEFSPQRDFFIDAWSRADHPPVHELRRSSDGALVCELEKADASALLAAGWTMPERFVAKGRDGKTDIHGVIVKPSNFDPSKKYPVVENIYAGPHGAFTPKEFGRLLGHHTMAELGFIVVQMDGMGTNHRGKAFHDVCWKNLKDAGFPDRKLWITAAAKTRPWMDLTRVGIYGGSAGGQNAMRALLDHHDFYQVAVADCGCHDNRMDKIWWNEQWMGWPVDDSYKRSSNVADAAKLNGHLLLIVGELDTNVDPASTTQAVGALQKAGKTFDFMPIIGTGHGAAETPFGSRLRMEFLVRHLKP